MGVALCANYPAAQSILPHSQTVTMLLCREQLYLAPIARPSKTQGRATQAIQSSIHPGRANPTRSRTPKNPCSAFFRAFCGHQMKPQKTQKYAEILDRLASDNLRTTCVEASKRIVLASFSVYLRFQRQIIEPRNQELQRKKRCQDSFLGS
jgi:hypothetical protein